MVGGVQGPSAARLARLSLVLDEAVVQAEVVPNGTVPVLLVCVVVEVLLNVGDDLSQRSSP